MIISDFNILSKGVFSKKGEWTNKLPLSMYDGGSQLWCYSHTDNPDCKKIYLNSGTIIYIHFSTYGNIRL